MPVCRQVDIFPLLTTDSKVNATAPIHRGLLDCILFPGPSPRSSRNATTFQLRSDDESEEEILTLLNKKLLGAFIVSTRSENVFTGAF